MDEPSRVCTAIKDTIMETILRMNGGGGHVPDRVHEMTTLRRLCRRCR